MSMILNYCTRRPPKYTLKPLVEPFLSPFSNNHNDRSRGSYDDGRTILYVSTYMYLSIGVHGKEGEEHKHRALHQRYSAMFVYSKALLKVLHVYYAAFFSFHNFISFLL